MLIVSRILVKIISRVLKHVGIRKGSEGGSLQLLLSQEETSGSSCLVELLHYVPCTT